MITARADFVGSLLRPPELLEELRRRFAEGALSAPKFKRVEDGTLDRAISLQERLGLRS